MEREELEQRMVSRLYGEQTDEERLRLEGWLASHPEDRAEFDELQRTFELLNRLRDDDGMSTHNVVSIPYVPRSMWWRGWTWVAAASMLVFILAATQGIALQIGSFRIGFGVTGESAGMRELIRQELAVTYKPTLDELVQTVATVQTSRELSEQRLTGVEQGLQDLFAIQKNSQVLADRKMERAFSDFATNLDQRLQSYLARMNPAFYSPLPVSNKNQY